MASDNNPYVETSTAFLIDGYYMPCPSRPETKTPEAAFETAKKQLIERLEKQIDRIKEMTCERFLSLKCRGI